VGLFWWLQGDVIFKAKRREWQLHLPLCSWLLTFLTLFCI